MARDLGGELCEMMPRLRRFAVMITRSRVDADDLLQAACERALCRRAQLRSETKIGAWMYAMMRNLWIDEIRARRSHLYDSLEAANDLIGEDGLALTESANSRAMVLKAVSALPLQQRLALILVCVDGMSYKETAAILDIPIGTVTSRIARGRQALHEQLTGNSSPVVFRSTPSSCARGND